MRIARTHQRRASVIRYLRGGWRRGFRVDVITIASGRGRHVAGGVRRHVAAAAAAARRVLAARVVVVLSRRRGHLPHRSDGRVRAVRAGQRADAHQHVRIGRVSGARVARAETIKKKKNTGNQLAVAEHTGGRRYDPQTGT